MRTTTENTVTKMPRKKNEENTNSIHEELTALMDEVYEVEVAKYLGELAEELEQTGDVETVKIKLAGIRKFRTGEGRVNIRAPRG